MRLEFGKQTAQLGCLENTFMWQVNSKEQKGRYNEESLKDRLPGGDFYNTGANKSKIKIVSYPKHIGSNFQGF